MVHLCIGRIKIKITECKSFWFSQMALINCNSCQSSFDSIPAKIRLGEDVLKTSWRRLQDVFSVTFFCLPRRAEDVLKTSSRHKCKTSCKHILMTSWKPSWRRLENVLKTSCKTSWRCLEDILGGCVANTSWRRLQDVFKRSSKTKSVMLKMSSRGLEDVLEKKKCLLGN